MEKYFKRKSKELEESSEIEDQGISQDCLKYDRVAINFESLLSNPGLQKKINDYHQNDRDEIRRYIKKDGAFCLACYLFRPENGNQRSGDSFVSDRFTAWKKKERLKIHIGGSNSAHNNAWKICEDLMTREQHIDVAFSKHFDKTRLEYQIQLGASVDRVHYLLHQGLPFHGHDELEESNNQGNFCELLRFLRDHNETINDVLENAPKNLKLVHTDIQKDIFNVAAIETVNAIISDLGDDLFALLVDESRDKGSVVERFIGIVHVIDTTSLSLKAVVESLFSTHGLSWKRLRGQGYNETSNMQGQFNGLKILILKENTSTFYIHCFAHQLQLALVMVAKNHVEIGLFFNLVSSLLNVVGASCKHRDILQQKQLEKVSKALKTTLKRPSDTRWGSHCGTLLRLLDIFSSVMEVLEIIMEDGVNSEQRAEASSLLDAISSFDFIFKLYLMWKVLGITNELSQALQRKDQDIVNAMKLVKISKDQLQKMREEKWDSLLIEAFSFYMQLQEPNDQFDEVNTELLCCVDCLNPNNSFEAFDKQKLIRLAKFYLHDFSSLDRLALDFYLLIKLALILPMATATVERAFSAMAIIKNQLRNLMGDQFMNDCLITYIEKDIFSNIDNKSIMRRFQNMKNCRGQL
ncbi:hypothetical protein CDL12_04927 [Handroanthus impetiginosus]|uniref:TTF-type domain-containing protein n=1 Tax=Handroanthus impetiginosus TaxID=429701 RepID=A0A2G9HXW2_9LAMI|nr:hypothetical protein CDL12_04927 [Handroanthus impetiginosus]